MTDGRSKAWEDHMDSLATQNKCQTCDKKIVSPSGKCGLCKAKERFFTAGNRKNLLLGAGIPLRLAEKALSLYQHSTINKNAPNGTLFSKLFDTGLFYHGEAGVGKSVTAACILLHDMEASFADKEHRNHKRTHKFITCGDILEDIKTGFNNNENIQDKYRQVDFLVIDDLGAEKMSDWVFATLYAIIDYRFGWYKTTVYTSNYSIKQISGKLGDERIPRRIVEASKVIELS